MRLSTIVFSMLTLSLLFLAGCNKFERSCLTEAGTTAMMNVAVCPTWEVQVGPEDDTSTIERPLALATAFAGDGLAEFDFNSTTFPTPVAKSDVPAAIVKQSTSGNLIIVGTSLATFPAGPSAPAGDFRGISAVRVNLTTGLFDATYSAAINPSQNGRIVVRDTLGHADVAGAVTLPDGSVWAGYTLTKTADPADTDFALVGFASDGTLQRLSTRYKAPNFAAYPSYSDPIEKNSAEVLTAIILDSQRRPLLLGSTDVRGGTKVALRRLNTNWSQDYSFAPGASGRQATLAGFTVIEAELSASDATPRAMALDSTGRILIVGTSKLTGATHTNIFVIRLSADGVLDTNFNPPNLDMGMSKNDEGLAIAIQSDGKILVGGVAMGATKSDLALLRLLPESGALDTSFDLDGKKRLELPTDGRIHSLALQGSKILALGETKVVGVNINQKLLVRFNSDGAVDSVFGTAGVMRFDNTVSGVVKPASGRASLWDGSSYYFTGEADRGQFTGLDFMVGKLN